MNTKYAGWLLLFPNAVTTLTRKNICCKECYIKHTQKKLLTGSKLKLKPSVHVHDIAIVQQLYLRQSVYLGR